MAAQHLQSLFIAGISAKLIRFNSADMLCSSSLQSDHLSFWPVHVKMRCIIFFKSTLLHAVLAYPHTWNNILDLLAQHSLALWDNFGFNLNSKTILHIQSLYLMYKIGPNITLSFDDFIHGRYLQIMVSILITKLIDLSQSAT